MDWKRRTGSEIEYPHRDFIPILECDISLLSGAVFVLPLPVHTRRLYSFCFVGTANGRTPDTSCDYLRALSVFAIVSRFGTHHQGMPCAIQSP